MCIITLSCIPCMKCAKQRNYYFYYPSIYISSFYIYKIRFLYLHIYLRIYIYIHIVFSKNINTAIPFTTYSSLSLTQTQT